MTRYMCEERSQTPNFALAILWCKKSPSVEVMFFFARLLYKMCKRKVNAQPRHTKLRDGPNTHKGWSTDKQSQHPSGEAGKVKEWVGRWAMSLLGFEERKKRLRMTI